MSGHKGYLLDTNILSETRKKRPEQGVLDFIAGVDSTTIYVSVLTLGELRKGIALKKFADAVAAESLARWVDGLESSFGNRILPINAAVARLWGELSAERSRPVVDTLLAATAVHYELTFVTRNVQDIDGIDMRIVNPWNS